MRFLQNYWCHFSRVLQNPADFHPRAEASTEQLGTVGIIWNSENFAISLLSIFFFLATHLWGGKKKDIDPCELHTSVLFKVVFPLSTLFLSWANSTFIHNILNVFSLKNHLRNLE